MQNVILLILSFLLIAIEYNCQPNCYRRNVWQLIYIPNISSNQFWQCQDFGTIWSPIPSLKSWCLNVFTAMNDFGLVFVVVGMHWKTAKNNKSIAAPIGCLRYGSHISWTNMEVFSWNKKMPTCAFQGHCFLILISLCKHYFPIFTFFLLWGNIYLVFSWREGTYPH